MCFFYFINDSGHSGSSITIKAQAWLPVVAAPNPSNANKFANIQIPPFFIYLNLINKFKT